MIEGHGVDCSGSVGVRVTKGVIRRVVEIVTAGGAVSVAHVAGVDTARPVKRGILIENESVKAPIVHRAVGAVLLLSIGSAVNSESGLPVPVVPETPEGPVGGVFDVEAKITVQTVVGITEFHRIGAALVVVGVDIDRKTAVFCPRKEETVLRSVEGNVGDVAVVAVLLLRQPAGGDLIQTFAHGKIIKINGADQFFGDLKVLHLDVVVKNAGTGSRGSAGAVGENQILEAVAASDGHLVSAVDLTHAVDVKIEQASGQIDLKKEFLPRLFRHRASIGSGFASLFVRRKIITHG